ncbi:MAG: tail fiber domain-containing protein [Bacteroidia bacterium]|nr:tail fiber domain-containing protein [Bacteroidia bacterium]
MKNLFFLACLFYSLSMWAQTTHLTVNGKYLLGNCGDTIVLRGVNYAVYNWGYSPTQIRFDQIAQTGANAVRIPWYASGSPALYADWVKLDSALSKCIQYDMIPILDLHDQTCQNDPAALTTMTNWWTQPSFLALENKYRHSLIINVANEALFVAWTGNPATAQTTFTNTYTTIVNNLRNAGIQVPLMIDGPDCGTNLDVLSAVASTLQTNDPQHNLIFSAHAYWYGYANNDSLTMRTKITNAVNANFPFIFGEVANQQDDQVLCQYNLNYRPVLSMCQEFNIGWCAWSWDNDGCPNRQVTTNGNFSSLTPYGSVIVNNPYFGISNTAVRSKYLEFGVCSSGNNDHNTNYGDSSFVSNTSGDYNSAFGFNSLKSSISGNHNSSFGYNSLKSNTSGLNNVAVGSNALRSNTSGKNNVSIGNMATYAAVNSYGNTHVGFSAGYNAKGSGNVALGDSALFAASGSTGSFNTSIGRMTMRNLTTGRNNVALGDSALFSLTTSANTVAIGKSALKGNTTGTNNLALGSYVLTSNSTGNGNTGIGFQALMNNSTGSGNQAFGYQALAANLVGSNNMAIGYQALNANTTSNNMAIGYQAMQVNTSGSNNMAIGFRALQNNTTAGLNVAMGYSSMQMNTTGANNVGVGANTLKGNTTGGNNVAIGESALTANTTGSTSVAVGGQALKAQTVGVRNIAVGYQSQQATVNGNNNVSMGQNSMNANTSGSNNVALGTYSMRAMTTGGRNTAIGDSSLAANLAGVGNVGVGRRAGALRSDYTNCTFLGQNADASTAGFSNAMALGNGAVVNSSNKVIVGNTSVTSIGGQVGWTTFSDRRLKTNIRPSELGLEFINQLNPVTYEYTAEGQKGIRYTGLIAQEVDEAAKGTFSGVDKNGEYWGIRYAELTVPLVSAVKEQNQIIENQQSQIQSLESQIQNLTLMLSQLSTDLQSCCLKETNAKTSQAIVLTGENPYLEQNVPNPFTKSTTIQYYIPQNVKSAILQIQSVNGDILQTVEIQTRGVESTEIKTGELSWGTYYYSLILDGKIFQTRKMIISNQ